METKQGYTPKQFKYGENMYTPVKERILVIKNDGIDYEIVTDATYYPDKRKWMVKASLVVHKADGSKRVFQGHASEMESGQNLYLYNALEVCETSAIGRAIGASGIGIEDSFASLEEVERAHRKQEEANKNSPIGGIKEDLKKTVDTTPIKPQNEHNLPKEKAVIDPENTNKDVIRVITDLKLEQMKVESLKILCNGVIDFDNYDGRNTTRKLINLIKAERDFMNAAPGRSSDGAEEIPLQDPDKPDLDIDPVIPKKEELKETVIPPKPKEKIDPKFDSLKPNKYNIIATDFEGDQRPFIPDVREFYDAIDGADVSEDAIVAAISVAGFDFKDVETFSRMASVEQINKVLDLTE